MSRKDQDDRDDESEDERFALMPPPRLLPNGVLPAVIEPGFRDLPPTHTDEIEAWEPFASGPVENVLTDELALRAEETALASEQLKEALADKRFIVIGATLRASNDEKRRPTTSLDVMVFNYTDNIAIQVHLDRQAGHVIGVERMGLPGPGFPARESEIGQAVALARGDERLAQHLADGLEGNAILVGQGDPNNPGNHRRFDVRFGYPDERLPRFYAMVDLSTETVLHAGPILTNEQQRNG